MKRTDWAIALTLALCALGVAACGGGGGDGTESAASREEAQLEFAECMREHGVDVPDPKPGQAGMVFGGTTRSGPGGKNKTTTGIDPEDPATKKALAACESKMPEGQQMSPEQEEEFKESALAFAECMREHGVNMPDPRFSGKGKVSIQIKKGGLDPNSPAFEEAQEACRKKAPGGGPTIGGPPPSP
jgi:hypothetical protein